MKFLGCLFGLILGILFFGGSLFMMALQALCRMLGIDVDLFQHSRQHQQRQQQQQQKPQDEPQQQTSKHSVFNDDEGEYVDFEEIKDDSSN